LPWESFIWSPVFIDVQEVCSDRARMRVSFRKQLFKEILINTI